MGQYHNIRSCIFGLGSCASLIALEFQNKKKTIICTSQLAVINDTILSPSHSVGKYTKMSY